ncbi:MAG: GNAT family N-acetyltransferase [Paludibacteraceae bacterium]|nr:GNAT family N-acetyltransferase [Paludibacteraceae bacterium]
MESRNVTIRPAKLADAALIAKAVAMGIGDVETLENYCGADYESVLTDIAATTGTQYSWQNALVAEVDGQGAGAIVGYDGAKLYNLRKGTLQVVMDRVGKIPAIADETQPGEYYIDTLAVLPEFRGMGIGKALIDAFCSNVFQQGYTCVGLIVDDQNLSAQALYASLGFEQVGLTPFFDHLMFHLQLNRV